MTSSVSRYGLLGDVSSVIPDEIGLNGLDSPLPGLHTMISGPCGHPSTFTSPACSSTCSNCRLD